MPRKPDNVVSADAIEHDKSSPIRFVGGAYGGKNGWLRKSKSAYGVDKIWVLVDMGNSTIKKTYVNIEYIGNRLQKPKSWVDAMLQQHVNIEIEMNTLCRKLACFSLDKSAKVLILTEIAKRLDLAIGRQHAKGHRANWKRVEYGGSDDHSHFE